MRFIVKKFAAAACALVLGAVSFGCDKRSTEINPPKLSGAFTCTASMTCGELEASAEITRLGENMWEALFSNPSTLAGVKLCFYDDTVSASYKGLEFSVPKAAMPVESMMSGFIDVVEELAKSTEKIKATEKDGALEVEGKTQAGDYTMSFDKDGSTPVKFEMPSLPLCIKFECFSTDVTTVPEESTSAPPAETSATEAESAVTT